MYHIGTQKKTYSFINLVEHFAKKMLRKMINLESGK